MLWLEYMVYSISAIHFTKRYMKLPTYVWMLPRLVFQVKLTRYISNIHSVCLHDISMFTWYHWYQRHARYQYKNDRTQLVLYRRHTSICFAIQTSVICKPPTDMGSCVDKTDWRSDYNCGLNLIPTRMSNQILYKMWDDITYPLHRWSLGMDS